MNIRINGISEKLTEGEVVAHSKPHAKLRPAAVKCSAANCLAFFPDNLGSMAVCLKVTRWRVHAIVRIVVLDLVVVPAISNSTRHIGIGSAAGEILTGTRALSECLGAHK